MFESCRGDAPARFFGMLSASNNEQIYVQCFVIHDKCMLFRVRIVDTL